MDSYLKAVQAQVVFFQKKNKALQCFWLGDFVFVCLGWFF